MKELFVSINIATRLKEKVFNEPCIARYTKHCRNRENPHGFQMNQMGNWYKHNSGEISKNYISAPMFQQVVDWFRITHGLVLDVFQEFDEAGESYTGKWVVDISRFGKYEHPHVVVVKETFTDYYEALDKAIDESLNVI